MSSKLDLARHLSGKVAIVSGSSTGIGAAIAHELYIQGAHVVINFPSPSERQSALEALKRLEGEAESIIVEADLSTTTGPASLVKETVAKFGHIDILVNNAGISKLVDFDTVDHETLLSAWDSVINLNSRETLLLTHVVLKHFTKKDCRIFNTCSAASRVPEPRMAVYAASKGMIESITRCWATELPRKYGCTVNSIAPGLVETEAIAAVPAHIKEIFDVHANTTPVAPRMARPSEIANVAAFICGPGASWVNGAYTTVSGGMTLG